jgi:hypothetical protein
MRIAKLPDAKNFLTPREAQADRANPAILVVALSTFLARQSATRFALRMLFSDKQF